MIGKKYMIAGMALEIVSDAGESWQTRNITTRETVLIKKAMLKDAIKLGKAEKISEMDDKE